MCRRWLEAARCQWRGCWRPPLPRSWCGVACLLASAPTVQRPPRLHARHDASAPNIGGGKGARLLEEAHKAALAAALDAVPAGVHRQEDEEGQAARQHEGGQGWRRSSRRRCGSVCQLRAPKMRLLPPRCRVPLRSPLWCMLPPAVPLVLMLMLAPGQALGLALPLSPSSRVAVVSRSLRWSS